WRRLSDVLCRGQGAPARGHARGATPGGALPLRLRRHQGGGAVMSATLCPVAILAGGLATRLQPLTDRIPKALVDVNGEPFIAHQLRLLRDRGVERVIVCAGYLGEMTLEYVGDGARFGLQVEFSFDGPRLLGTAAALKNALPLLGDSFFALYGDSYPSCDYLTVQREFVKSEKPALMTV